MIERGPSVPAARPRVLPALCTAAVLFAGCMPALAGAGSPRVSYVLNCSGCHGMTGEGTPSAGIPTFPGSVGHIADSDIGRTYMMHVPGIVSASLSDAEIAAVVNYVLDAWGDGAPHFTAEEVTRRRSIPVPDVVAFRRDVVAELAGQGVTIADYPWP